MLKLENTKELAISLSSLFALKRINRYNLAILHAITSCLTPFYLSCAGDSGNKYHVIEKWLTRKLVTKQAKGNKVIYRSVAGKFFAVCLIFLYIQIAHFLVINKTISFKRWHECFTRYGCLKQEMYVR